MKKIVLLLAFLALGLGAGAQNTNNGWPQRQSHEQINVDPDGQNITIDRNMYVWRPFDDVVGYSIYGSRYRKAKANKVWGMFLSVIVAPLSGVLLAYGIDEDDGAAIIGGAALAGSLGAGIPLWVKGRRQLDWMLDDYVERYGPKPHATAVTVGPTANGVGLALNF